MAGQRGLCCNRVGGLARDPGRSMIHILHLEDKVVSVFACISNLIYCFTGIISFHNVKSVCLCNKRMGQNHIQRKCYPRLWV